MKSILLNPSIPDDPKQIECYKMQYLKPKAFNGWIPETLSWKKTAYLSANLSTEMPCVHVKGPDAVRLLNENCVNNFTKLPVGAGRHAIMCSEKGDIVAHGMVLRFAEDDFGTYGLAPIIMMLGFSGRYKVEPMSMDPKDFIYQIGGPKSLEIAEQAAGEDIRDIKFSRFRDAQIAGHRVRILRIGMAGTLAYEVHGPLESAHDVYNKIMEVGTPYGIEKLGYHAYTCNHAENGFPQSGLHFMYAWKDYPGMAEFFADNLFLGHKPMEVPPSGSLSDDINDYFRNPIELGWKNMIKFDHDFVGRQALEKIAAGPHREIVTLVWDPEDVLDVFASYLKTDHPPYKFIRYPQAEFNENLFGNSQDRVIDKNGKVIGKSSTPVYTLHSRQLISLSVVDPEYADRGKEVIVVWGDPGDRKKNMRAKVEKFPILDLPANREFDLDSIPKLKPKS